MNLRRNIIFSLLGCLFFNCNGIYGESSLAIIPQPVKVERLSGFYLFSAKSYFSISPDQNELKEILNPFTGLYKPHTLIVKSENKADKQSIRLELLSQNDNTLGDEGYRLRIEPKGVRLEANKEAGIFYGLQTLMQLLPADYNGTDKINIPCVSILDYPRFQWRGLLLDVSRHFFSKEFLKRYIDQMAKYKYNILQLHLTDDQGWRIQIDALPALTEKGAWRAERVGRFFRIEPQQSGEPATEGGFYTKADMREIIEYAKQRKVLILPEIEMPGHSLAAIVAYPGLSCTGEQYRVNVGNNFYGKEDNALCVGNEAVFEYVDKVLEEVADLFPSPYIHIGGDECFKGFWQECPKCQKRIEEEGLKNLHELQSYFIKRVQKIAQSKGKQIIGWDEILEGGLAPGAIVTSWRGINGGIAAARKNHQVIMSPMDYCYLDLYQGEPSVEPKTYSMCLLSDCYNYEPVPENVDPYYILGGQGNLWTESVPAGRHAEYMTWPRAFALAETFWSAKDVRDWKSFIPRMEQHMKRLDASGVNYAKSVYNVIVSPVKDAEGKMTHIELGAEIEGTEIYYTFDETDPDRYSKRYEGIPLSIPKSAETIRCITYYKDKIGKVVSLSLDELAKRRPIHRYNIVFD
ncbi:family 20 glycosylhydrolase [uncultured Proteiniphilum sp.]|uniref:beta-N-acetylhexosaminidase n=1 Tax=uncultured Proteiniphilum sp. TaxID=497637 RepID=UPI0026249618|nr:family 20 glycosylhydrolase [uncultured Proteiniphilum sp.]